MRAQFAATVLPAVLAITLLAGCPPKKPTGISPVPDGENGATTGNGSKNGAGSVDTSVPVHDRVEQAIALIESGSDADLRQAIALLESAVADDRSGVVRYNLGLAYQHLGDTRSAQNQYQSVISVDPDNGYAWLGLGKVHEQEGDHRAALSTYETGVQNVPNDVELSVALINALRRNGRVDDSIAAAREAIKVNAKSLPVYNALGLAYLEKNNLVLARFVFQKAIQEIDDAEDNAMLQANFGRAYYLADDKAKGTEHLQRALQLAPDLVIAKVYLARIYMDDHNYADTVPLLEEAARLDPGNADIQLTLGVAYRGVGRLDDAEKAYERALQLDEADPSPHLNLGVLKGDYRKDYKGAVAAFNTYLDAGGVERELVEGYIRDVERERKLSEKRAKAAEERKARAEERKRKEALANQPDPEPEPEAPEETPETPPGDDAPTEDGADPEGSGGEGEGTEAGEGGDTPKEDP